MDKDKIFALDIGTRKIVGLVMQKSPSGYEVLDSEMIEHSTRAMLDGQIHDVQAVAGTIQDIKKALEERLGMNLDAAAVAAAGRALKTARGQAESNRSYVSEIDSEEVRALEVDAVQQAQYLLARDELGTNEGSNYFCVGYSVISYHLENQPIGNLVGQVGNRAAVEVVATFLPRVVVDSLFSSLKKAQLDVYSMTLEPIAALSVAIPPNMRLLNLALVDIGAGTSDIAVVKNGNIFAYAMVPSGGDKLSEHIAAEYLMDFNSAEKLKCLVNNQPKLQCQDILGKELEMSDQEIKDMLDPVVRALSAEIARNILELNSKPPDAILCVGGGSLTPGLVSHLADELSIPRNRIGIRTRESFKHIKAEFAALDGPQGVTPLGIAFNSFDKPPLPFIQVIVNGREVALWNLGDIDVAGALLSSGISLNNVYGKPGMGKTVEINGYLKVFKGEMGTSPVIRLNGKDASLETPVRNGDQIEFNKGEDGQDAIIKRDSIKPGPDGYVFVNGEKLELSPRIKINGQEWASDDDIPDRSIVEIQRLDSLSEILAQAGVSEHLLEERLYHYYLNDKPMILKWTPVKITVDGKETPLNETVTFGSYIEYRLDQENPRIKDIAKQINEVDEYTVTINGEQAVLKGKKYAVTRNGYLANPEDELFSGAKINVEKRESSIILSDIFQIIDIKPSMGGKLIMTVNGQDAGYTTPVANNSVIKIEWE